MIDLLPLLSQFEVNPGVGLPTPPRWGWYIVLYFFLGGLAAGLYFIGTMLDMLGDPRDDDAVRFSYLAALPLVAVCGVLLIVDLGVPLRFWHLLIRSEQIPMPILKYWSPISVGSWVLMAFSLFAFVSFLGALVQGGRLRWTPLVRADDWVRRRPRKLKMAWQVLGAFFGFFLAGYTGVLLVGTTSPLWHNAQLLGAIFLASAASTSYALLILWLLRRGRRHDEAVVAKLAAADRWAIAIELALILITVLWLGSVARPMIWGVFGVFFWLGVVGVGLVAPLVLHSLHGPPERARRRAMTSAALVLAGGLVLRIVVVLAPQVTGGQSPWHL